MSHYALEDILAYVSVISMMSAALRANTSYSALPLLVPLAMHIYVDLSSSLLHLKDTSAIYFLPSSLLLLRKNLTGVAHIVSFSPPPLHNSGVSRSTRLLKVFSERTINKAAV